MNFHIVATERTPEVILTSSPLCLRLKGESYPEDVSAFYGEVINAVDALSKSPRGDLQVDFELIYINSSSIKALYRIFEGFESYRKLAQSVRINWKADPDDDIMVELGEDFKDRFPALDFQVDGN